MIKRNADGSLFIGEIVEDKPVENADIIGDKFLVENETEKSEIIEEKPKNKGGRPRKN